MYIYIYRERERKNNIYIYIYHELSAPNSPVSCLFCWARLLILTVLALAAGKLAFRRALGDSGVCEKNNSFCASLLPCNPAAKNWSPPDFGALRAHFPPPLLVRRSVFFTDTGMMVFPRRAKG